jgi:hypothetical protein
VTVEDNWLRDVVVVNESDDVHVAGDVQVYRNATDMSHQLEHWYVDVPHLALDGLGRRAVLGSTGDRIIIERLEDYADGRALLQTWLLSTARSRQALNEPAGSTSYLARQKPRAHCPPPSRD